VLIPPYAIIFQKNNTTTVEKVISDHHYSHFESLVFKHVFTVDGIIHPDTPEKILARIKLLSLMS